jgi:hypothetical protein
VNGGNIVNVQEEHGGREGGRERGREGGREGGRTRDKEPTGD